MTYDVVLLFMLGVLGITFWDSVLRIIGTAIMIASLIPLAVCYIVANIGLAIQSLPSAIKQMWFDTTSKGG